LKINSLNLLHGTFLKKRHKKSQNIDCLLVVFSKFILLKTRCKDNITFLKDSFFHVSVELLNESFKNKQKALALRNNVFSEDCLKISTGRIYSFD